MNQGSGVRGQGAGEKLKTKNQKPKTDFKDKRQSRINYFRSTEVERWQWEKAARDSGVTLSEFLRKAANGLLRRIKRV